MAEFRLGSVSKRARRDIPVASSYILPYVVPSSQLAAESGEAIVFGCNRVQRTSTGHAQVRCTLPVVRMRSDTC